MMVKTMTRRIETGIPARLKELRRERDLTQTELASIIGVGRAAVANWESGIRLPKNSAIMAICRYFDVTPDYLCGRVDVRNVVIAPPVFRFDLGKLNYNGQKSLYNFYEYLLTREEFTE